MLLHDLLTRASARAGNELAVIDGDRAITYRELDDRSSQLANVLRSAHVMVGDRVALHLGKSLDAIVSIFAVLKAGAAYVPIDPLAPEPRARYVAADCGVRCVITTVALRSVWTREPPDGLASIVVIDDEGSDPNGPVKTFGMSDVDSEDRHCPPCRLIDVDLAYVLYTSGSTGVPKGVVHSHRSGMAFVEWAVARFQLSAQDRVSSHAPLHFDLSIFDVFATVSVGGTLVLVPRTATALPSEFRRFLKTLKITVCYAVPSAFTALVVHGGLAHGDLEGLRVLLFAGEVFPTRHLRSLRRLLPGAEMFNLFGPTETNVCTAWRVPEALDSDDPIPIGAAIENVDVYSLTDEGDRAGVGEVGELCVRGATLMSGYWGDPDRTREVLGVQPGASTLDLVYRTGDVVVQQVNGDYLFLGRRDSQVKSRGYRIELGDIETALYSHDDVVECAAIAVPDEFITSRIKAVVVARNGLDELTLLRFCAAKLPRYMVPDAIEMRRSLPRTSTGKVDRRAIATERSR